jgi:hypothetical protein
LQTQTLQASLGLLFARPAAARNTVARPDATPAALPALSSWSADLQTSLGLLSIDLTLESLDLLLGALWIARSDWSACCRSACCLSRSFCLPDLS